MTNKAEEFTSADLRILRFLVNNRLNYEKRRPSKVIEGEDIQQKKVWELAELREKIERIQLAQ